MRGFLLGGLLILTGVVGAIVFGGVRLDDLDERIDAFPKTRLSEGAVELRRGEHNVYIDAPSGAGEFGWNLTVRDPQRRPVPVRAPDTQFDYELGGREGRLVGKLTVTVPGRHVIRGHGPTEARVIFGRGVLRGVAAAVIGALAIFFVLGAAGLVLIIVTAARRGRGPREGKRWP